MPRYRTTFEKKRCPDNFEERKRYPGCSLGDNKPFEPHSRKPQILNKPKPIDKIPEMTAVKIPEIQPESEPEEIEESEESEVESEIEESEESEVEPESEEENDEPEEENEDDELEQIRAYSQAAYDAYEIYKDDPVAHLETGEKPKISYPLQPSANELTPQQKLSAEMIKVSTQLHETNYDTANARAELTLRDQGWELLKDRSNDNVAVFKKKGTNEVHLSIRGTDVNHKIQSGRGIGESEMSIWPKIATTGTERSYDFFKQPDDILRGLQNDGFEVSRVNGYSMGGTAALHLSNKYKIPSTLINPYLGARALFDDLPAGYIKPDIVRTTADPASAGYVLSPDRFNVTSIEPVNTTKYGASTIHYKEKGSTNIYSLFDHHELEHMTTEGDDISTEPMAIREFGRKSNEIMMREQAISAIRNNKTYAQYIHEVNSHSGQDTENVANQVRLNGPRVGKSSHYAQIWEQEGGTYTADELAHTFNLPDRPPPQSALSPAEQEMIRSGQTENLRKSIQEPLDVHLENIKENLNFKRSKLNTLIKGSKAIKQGAGGIASNVAGAIGFNSLEDALEIEHNSLVDGAGAGAGGELLISGKNAGLRTAMKASLAVGDVLEGKSLTSAMTNLALRSAPQAIEAAKLGVNLRKASAAGALGAGTQEVTYNISDAVFNSVGIPKEAGEIAAQTIGGAAGGAVTAATIESGEALAARAATAARDMYFAETGTAAERVGLLAAEEGITAETVATGGSLFPTFSSLFTVAETGTAAEGIGLLAAEGGAVAAEIAAVEAGATVGSFIPVPGVGTMVGAGIGALIAGGIAVYSFLDQENESPEPPPENEEE